MNPSTWDLAFIVLWALVTLGFYGWSVWAIVRVWNNRRAGFAPRLVWTVVFVAVPVPQTVLVVKWFELLQ